ncbi:MAG: phage holin family protein, partial [Chloroflexota bacterium]
MSRLLGFYETQFRVLWEWRGGPVALLKRLLITLVVATISFLATAWLMPRLTVDGLAAGVLAVVLISLFNAGVRPVVLALAAPISLILVGVLVLVLQVVSFVVIAQWSPGVHVDGFGTALVASFVYAIINTILTGILGVDSGDSYYGLLVQRLLVKRSRGHTDKPGLVILQIDGLAHPILAGRMRAGSVNTMANWVRDGSHKLSKWEAILPSMTSGSQAGILHGNNDGIPAFRWYERDRKHLMASSNPVDATLIASRISNGEGLLSNNGASICNLLTGDATRSYLTTAAIKAEGGGIGDSNAFMSFFFSPTGYLRSFTLFLGELFKERLQNRRARRRGVEPRLDRDFKYAGMRAASNVLLRDMNVSLIIEEMYRGANVIYADFTDYDEIAHHSGPERLEALQALDGIDDAFATIVKAAEDAPRPYRFVVLSDHGQSLGATFKQRYGESLGDLIKRLMGGVAVAEQQTKAEGSA